MHAVVPHRRPKTQALAIPISVRLFLMCLLSMAIAAALALGLARWGLSDGTRHLAAGEARRIESVVRDLSVRFDDNGDWRFLPAERGARTKWLRSRLAQTGPHGDFGDELSTLGQRIALTDASGRRLAGDSPNRVLVALASIDQRRWTIPSRLGVAGYLSIAVPRDPDDALTVAFLIQKQRGLALLAVLGTALAALAAAAVAASFRRPLQALVGGARRLAGGDFDARIAADRRDEFGELADSFNELGARLSAASHSRRQWIADTSHELRTPLAVLQAQVEAMQDGIRPLTHAGLEPMRAQVNALRALIDDLDQLARSDVGTLGIQREPLDFWAVAEAASHDFDNRLRQLGLELRLRPPTRRASGIGDAGRLGQVFSNLLENSARYTAAGGCVSLAGEVEGGQVRIDLDDSAPAVPDAVMHRLGERFFRVDASRSRDHGGSGLGLALSRQIVEAHGGRLTFATSPLGGLRVCVTLPLGPA